MKTFKKLLIATTTLIALNFSSFAFAVPELTFDQTTDSGTLEYYGGQTALRGRNIGFQTITGSDTPMNDGVTLACTGCILTFDTVSVVTAGTIPPSGPDFLSFTGTGSFTLNGITTQTGAVAVDLITGTFT